MGKTGKSGNTENPQSSSLTLKDTKTTAAGAIIASAAVVFLGRVIVYFFPFPF